MRIGIALPVYDLATSRVLSTSELVASAQQAEHLGFDSVWLMDHHFVIRDGRRVGGHEPMVALSFIAAQTSKVALGGLVLCNTFRQPGQLAREVATLSDASAGRFILGLGCGSVSPEHEAFGIAFDHRVSRLQETLAVLRPTLSGDRISFEGRFVTMRDAEILTATSPPPIWLAAFGPRMLSLTARFADGWTGGWNGPDTSAFEAQVNTLKAHLREAGRGIDGFEIVATLLVVVANSASHEEVVRRAQRFGGELGPVQDRVVVGDLDRIAKVIRAYERLGATSMILAGTPRQFGRFDDFDLDELAQLPQALSRA